jgi:hypothetical protein
MYYLNQNKSITNKALGNIYLELSPLKGLKLKTDLGFDASMKEDNSFTPLYVLSNLNSNTTHNYGRMDYRRDLAYNWENTLTYNFNFGNLPEIRFAKKVLLMWVVPLTIWFFQIWNMLF